MLAQLTDEAEHLRRDSAAMRRELEIEAALERVRVKALGMQKSEDLVEVSGVLFEEFSRMGISPVRSSITIWNEAEDQWQSWVTRTFSTRSVVHDDSLKEICARFPEYGEGFAAWQRGEPHYVSEFSGEERINHLRSVKAFYSRSDEWLQETIAKTPDCFFIYQIFFSQGNLEISLSDSMGESELQIARRFADVFDIAYRRYGELQQAEAARVQLEEQNKALEESLRLLRETQNQMLQQEKMASLGDLVAGVAHELNTPLGAIRSMHDTLVRTVGKLKADAADPGQATIFKVIADADELITGGIERVSSIVASLKNFARLDEAEFQVVDLHEGIDSALTLLGSQLQGRIAVEKDYCDIPPVRCAPGQLNQVFMHLLKNAIQAIEGEGRIAINTFVDGDQICICFSDTGRGMAPEQVARLFDFDFQAGDGRVKMGFGLASDHKILQDHRGELKVASEMGRGTEMTVVLPVD